MPKTYNNKPNFVRLMLQKSHLTWTLLLGLTLLAPALISLLAAPLISPGDPFASVGEPFQPPSLAFPLGTDDLGRNMLSAVIHGAQTSLTVGLSVAAIALSLGLFIGLIAGFSGLFFDEILMRITEFFQVIPRFFLAVLVVSMFGGNIFHLIMVLALTSWSGLARIARAETLSLREREFVRSAYALGCGTGRILFRHIFPHVWRPLLATTALVVNSAILAEAGLSYLGLSDPDVMSWGYLIGNAQNFMHRAWWLSVLPGVSISITVLGIGLIVDSLRTK